MLFSELFTLLVLLLIFIQDIRSRVVYWVLFPILALLLLWLRLVQQKEIAAIWPSVLINWSFLLVELLLVSGWFSYKRRSWVNVTVELLGWGDILLWISMGVYFSVLNFLFFYIVSLILVLVIWVLRQILLKKENRQIPLAGLQALALFFYLGSDWWLMHLPLTNDDGWLQLIMK